MVEMRVTLTPIRGRVLIVHDIMYIRNQIRQILLGAGVRNIIEPEPGGDAYMQLRKNPEGFSLVIDDYDSNPSGQFLLKILRSDPSTPDLLKRIPFIMLLSNADPQIVSDVMASGASGILLKPFNGITLLKTIKRVMEKAGPTYQ
jgi:two-component system chemotaxis response regulator CheY